MGIKFYCPNGHKLNVKAFLGGKRAICPKCGAKVVVPPVGAAKGKGVAETVPVGLASPDAAGVALINSASDGAISPSVASWPTGPSVAPAAGDGVAGHATTPLPMSPTFHATSGLAPAGAATANTSLSPAASVPPLPDPIDEAPSSVWYVRPPSGGQFGPATGNIMRSWIDEGRVTSQTLVWRASWPEWRAGGDVFPKLGAGRSTVTAAGPFGSNNSPTASPEGSSPSASGAPPGPAVAAAAGSPTGQFADDVSMALAAIENETIEHSSIRHRASQRQVNETILWFCIIMVILAIVMVVVLIIYVSKNKNPPEDAHRGGRSSIARFLPGDESGLPRLASADRLTLKLDWASSFEPPQRYPKRLS